MKEYRKSINRIMVALLSIFVFSAIYGVCWVLNAEFKNMLLFTVPFVVLAEISWIMFGIHTDLEEKRKMEIAKKIKKRESLNYGNNVIYGFWKEEKEKYYLFKVS